MDWNDVRYFAATYRAGSLTGAARILGVSVQTVGRRIDALEAVIGSTLFVRHSGGYTATPDAGRRGVDGGSSAGRGIRGQLPRPCKWSNRDDQRGRAPCGARDDNDTPAATGAASHALAVPATGTRNYHRHRSGRHCPRRSRPCLASSSSGSWGTYGAPGRHDDAWPLRWCWIDPRYCYIKARGMDRRA